MLIYVTVEQYGTYVGSDSEDAADVAKMIELAHEIVTGACKHDRYYTLPNGFPENDDLKSAIHDAICMQVETWAAAGLTYNDLLVGDLNAGGVVTSTKIGSGQVNIDNSKAERARSALVAGGLLERPLRRLRRDGLASSVVA